VVYRCGWFFWLLVVLLAGCGPETISLIAPLGTAQHHVNAGHRLLDYGKPEAALREFSRARDLNPDFVPAYLGEALAHANDRRFDLAMENMHRANLMAGSADEKVAVHVGYMRIYTMGRDAVIIDWLKGTESEFAAALANNSRSAEAFYYMGEAYRQAGLNAKAATMYQRVVELEKGYTEAAGEKLAEVKGR